VALMFLLGINPTVSLTVLLNRSYMEYNQVSKVNLKMGWLYVRS
jgi:hypothetical protein